ncbi:hypothetical protein [Nocardia flavorosea]|uniref:hypothetical protein n=1 Tax=Nocardia flavorosea TaxID=53429 RepID=UPI002458AD53|nr:hypothetical protein [Nocardia flavorosea]
MLDFPAVEQGTKHSELFLVFRSFDPSGLFFDRERLAPVISSDLVELDALPGGPEFLGPPREPLRTVAEEPVGTVFEYSAALVVFVSFSVFAVPVRHD